MIKDLGFFRALPDLRFPAGQADNRVITLRLGFESGFEAVELLVHVLLFHLLTLKSIRFGYCRPSHDTRCRTALILKTIHLRKEDLIIELVLQEFDVAAKHLRQHRRKRIALILPDHVTQLLKSLFLTPLHYEHRERSYQNIIFVA